MNKKILFFVFISAAFFFGCSADGLNPNGVTPPAWDKAPPSLNGGKHYCLVKALGMPVMCEEISSDFTVKECNGLEIGGFISSTVVSECPDDLDSDWDFDDWF